MKRLATFLGASLLALSLVACGGKSKTPETTPPAATEPEKEGEAPGGTGEEGNGGEAPPTDDGNPCGDGAQPCGT